MDNFVTFTKISEENNVASQTVSRNVKKLKFEVSKRKNSTGGYSNCISRSDANELRVFFEQRNSSDIYEDENEVSVNRYGYFYLIQLVPEILPERVKIGYTDNIQQRLSQHRTAAPTSTLLKSWGCKRTWDQAAMDSISRKDCKHVLNEVYEGNIGGFIERGDKFFSNMPQNTDEILLSEFSPLNKA